jgi:pyruvate dehydrogenase E1 component alpha subunit
MVAEISGNEVAPVCAPDCADEVGREKLRDFVEQMMLIRRFEERCAREYASGHIAGFCHLYIGQEGVAVGSVGATTKQDHIITAYRDHGHALIRGCTPKSVMAELFGRVTGVAKGRGGSMHLFSVEDRFHGGHGIVGGHIPLATGFAFASKYEGLDDATLCYFGDGAINQGAFYESLNLASLWNLPILFICENNGYAMGTSLERSGAVSDLSIKAAGFGMKGYVANGNDVCHMHHITQLALEDARKNNRPAFIEARCYRYRGHSMSDPQKYRSKSEVKDQKNEDCILLAKNTLLGRGWATEAELKAWDKAAKEEAADSVEFALNSPEPDLKDVGAYVYKNPMGWRADRAMAPHDPNTRKKH